MKKTLLFLVFVAVFFGLKAQSDFRSGFIITNVGDTVYGKIDFRTDGSNYNACYFKKDSLSSTVKYTPDQLSAYRFINSKYYVSKKFKVKDQLVNLFLECLISGKTSIYYCHQRYVVGDLEKNDHYYAEKDTNFVELYAEKSFTNNDGKSFIQRTDQYKGALSAFFVDDPDIQGHLKKTDLNSKSLIDIAKQYHEDVCTANQCIVYEKKAIKRLFQFGVEASYFCSSLDFYEDRNRLTLNTAPKYDITTSVFAATNLDYDYRFWFQVELNYRKQEIDKTKVDVLIHQTTYNFKWSTLSSDLVIKYRFSNLKFKPYAFLGYGVGLVLDKEYIKTEGNLNVGNFTSRNIELDDKYTTNLFGGVGCEYAINSKSNLLFSLKYMLNRIPTVDSNGFSCSVGYFISVF